MEQGSYYRILDNKIKALTEYLEVEDYIKDGETVEQCKERLWDQQNAFNSANTLRGSDD